MILAGSQTALLVKLLDATRLRNDVIAQNVANVNTPGHQCLEVQFEGALEQALATADASRIALVQPSVVAGGGGPTRADGNNVDMDREMGRLQKNAVLFQLYTQLLSTQLSQYRSAISGH